MQIKFILFPNECCLNVNELGVKLEVLENTIEIMKANNDQVSIVNSQAL